MHLQQRGWKERCKKCVLLGFVEPRCPYRELTTTMPSPNRPTMHPNKLGLPSPGVPPCPQLVSSTQLTSRKKHAGVISSTSPSLPNDKANDIGSAAFHASSTALDVCAAAPDQHTAASVASPVMSRMTTPEVATLAARTHCHHEPAPGTTKPEVIHSEGTDTLNPLLQWCNQVWIARQCVAFYVPSVSQGA